MSSSDSEDSERRERRAKGPGGVKEYRRRIEKRGKGLGEMIIEVRAVFYGSSPDEEVLGVYGQEPLEALQQAERLFGEQSAASMVEFRLRYKGFSTVYEREWRVLATAIAMVKAPGPFVPALEVGVYGRVLGEVGGIALSYTTGNKEGRAPPAFAFNLRALTWELKDLASNMTKEEFLAAGSGSRVTAALLEAMTQCSGGTTLSPEACSYRKGTMVSMVAEHHRQVGHRTDGQVPPQQLPPPQQQLPPPQQQYHQYSLSNWVGQQQVATPGGGGSLVGGPAYSAVGDSASMAGGVAASALVGRGRGGRGGRGAVTVVDVTTTWVPQWLPPTGSCYNCGDMAHRSNACGNPAKCQGCGVPGHKAAQCPTNPRP